ncbi:Quaternary ammonium compound-resistance protein SugE [Labilithrix luteola]|uniref:Guanidinium exporter n=1 Tax=Labilithrix luteola TaxID=1391654 RepID=A0A0K1PSA5_9BACT|nr:quaternary ammonium compound efflux SMR transporter SugE [Labilithrix luteola]AKU96014.1 Quaternary ammonium compound-resistance protein SugE [Labilithrix luteola]
MAWVSLVVAGLLEIVWAIGLKYSHGFTRLGATIVTIVALVASFVLLGRAAKTLPIGTAYAVWVGIGAVGAAIGGMALLGERASVARIAFLSLIVAGIIGLKLTTHAE